MRLLFCAHGERRNSESEHFPAVVFFSRDGMSIVEPTHTVSWKRLHKWGACQRRLGPLRVAALRPFPIGLRFRWPRIGAAASPPVADLD